MFPTVDYRLFGQMPDAVQMYLAHTVDGEPIRAVARRLNCHASTVLRKIRRFESLRDDPLIDHALQRLGRQRTEAACLERETGDLAVTMTAQSIVSNLSDQEITSEAKRVLRRLSEPGACLAVAQGMDKAVVVREAAGGQTVRTSVVDTSVAEAMALKDWIGASGSGRVARYHLKPAGRAALKKILAECEQEAANARDSDPSDTPGRTRYGVADSPLLTLSRRRDKDGGRFLSEELVSTGERLREDFELARMGADAADDWEAFLTSPRDGATPTDATGQARARVADALGDLGPGLGDVVLRVCCYLEGLEAVEQRMGWAARSGKIVLRIALDRLQRHYQTTQGKFAPLIG